MNHYRNCYSDWGPTAERDRLPVNFPGRTAAFRAPRPHWPNPALLPDLRKTAGLARLRNSAR
jgi:hypothetical protein